MAVQDQIRAATVQDPAEGLGVDQPPAPSGDRGERRVMQAARPGSDLSPRKAREQAIQRRQLGRAEPAGGEAGRRRDRGRQADQRERSPSAEIGKTGSLPSEPADDPRSEAM